MTQTLQLLTNAIHSGNKPVSSSLGYLLGGAAGGVLAGRIFGRLRTLWLRRAFALLILYGGIRAVLLL